MTATEAVRASVPVSVKLRRTLAEHFSSEMRSRAEPGTSAVTDQPSR